MACNAMEIAAHAIYSPDLAHSDFYLFGHPNGLFWRESFETGEQLLSAVEDIFGSLAPCTLTKVFLEWMRRLEQYIETDDDYVG
jgi:hypothetical protein